MSHYDAIIIGSGAGGLTTCGRAGPGRQKSPGP